VPISPYVERLRKAIGNDLLLLPAVSILPRDAEGRILLVEHSYTGQWGLIGGTVEPEESPEAAALRETKEETGLDVALSLVGAVGGPEYRVTYPNGDRGAFVIAVYEAQVVGGELHPDGDETTDVGWFGPDELIVLDMNSLARALLTELRYIG
jgi:8-oxo-dGTP pyrophosphatase MutT (NUDIX family)